jgi:meso-butanediol dehydrogenase/(S,S)-butanediol dehydrogenase/diacetyl reductase
MFAADSRGPATLVTGAGGLIGGAIVRSLAQRGLPLVLIDQDQGALERLAGEVATLRAPVLTVRTDVTSDDQVHEAVLSAIRTFDVVNACVNGAGIEGPVVPIDELDLAEVAHVYDVNVLSIVRITKSLIPHLRAHGGGRIVNIASGAGLGGVAYMSAYSSSKHAVVGLTRCLALETARDRIAVNTVCPGPVDSPMVDRIEAQLEAVSGAPVSFRDAVPMRRYADASEIASIVNYLVHDAPEYLTGAALVIDGGLRV